MSSRSAYGVVLFHTTTAALMAEKALKAAGLEVKLMSAPRELSSDCTLALRIELGQGAAALALLENAGVETAGLHPL